LASAYVQVEVLGYLARRPGASDTRAGIIRWWLHEQRRFLGRETVREALRDLVARGELRERPLPDGDVLYSATDQSIATQQQE
jgi:hypothetical protein